MYQILGQQAYFNKNGSKTAVLAYPPKAELLSKCHIAFDNYVQLQLQKNKDKLKQNIKPQTINKNMKHQTTNFQDWGNKHADPGSNASSSGNGTMKMGKVVSEAEKN